MRPMRSLLLAAVALTITALLLASAAASGASTSAVGDLKVGYRLSAGGDGVDLCFSPVPKDYLGPHLGVFLRVTHVYKRGKEKRAHRSVTNIDFDLGDIGTAEREGYLIDTGGTIPCATFQPKNPFLISFKDVVQTGRFTLKPLSEGAWLPQATYAYTMRIVGARQVFQGTDAFVNYCINEGKKISSSNLKLYCWTDGDFRVSMRRVAS